MIELCEVHKTLHGRAVLQGVSLRIERGETVAIVGASGAGKSVTLRHIVGLLRPDRGEVWVDGQPVHSGCASTLERVRARVGYLFQSGALINWMNVMDNVALPLREKTKLSEDCIQGAAERCLALVGLAGAAEKMPPELSGGMKKRAGLARAIVREPEVVLYDEPTSGLDPVLSRAIDKLIRRLQRESGVTSAVVTHDLRSAFLVADRVVMLHEGRIVESAPPAAFRASRVPVVRDFIKAQFGDDNPHGCNDG